MTALRERMIRDLRVRNFSPRTESCYLRAVEGLARHYDKPPDQLTQREVEDYIAYLFHVGKYAPGSCHHVVTGLRFFYLVTLGLKPTEFLLPSLRRTSRLPDILSRQEVERLLAVVKNPKHKAMLMTTYGGGLRVSELVHLRVSDIQADRMMICKRRSKSAAVSGAVEKCGTPCRPGERVQTQRLRSAAASDPLSREARRCTRTWNSGRRSVGGFCRRG